MTQADHHAAAGTDNGRQPAEAPEPLAARHMHPDRAHPNQVESLLGPTHLVERRKTVVNPSNPGGRVPRPSRVPHHGRRLDSNHLVPTSGEPRGFAPAAGADVEHAAGGFGQKVENLRVHVLE